MELGDRKRKILQSIVEDYIVHAEPIGSRTIAKHTDMGLSSATIRNEMADLEEMGYLISPHTSAGRIPSDAGYRFYVNELMRQYEIASEDVIKLRRLFTAGVLQLDKLVRQASDIISQLTSYTTVAITPELSQSSVKRFEIMPVDEKSALLILVTNEGIVKNQLINTDEDESFLKKASALLNDKLAGLSLDQINLVRINEIGKILNKNSSLLMTILDFVHQAMSDSSGADIYVANTQNILKHPEYSDIDKAREIVGFLEDKQRVREAVDQSDHGERINVVIGQENDRSEIKETSIVTAKYLSGGNLLGRLSIVGPTRMNYAKVIASLDFITKNIDNIVNELYREEKGRD